MLKLRKILLSNYFYLILIILSFLIFSFRLALPRKSILNSKDNYFYGTVTKYNLTSSKLTIYLKNKETVIGTYYFQSTAEVTTFKKKVHLGDKLLVRAQFSKPIITRTENTFNYQKYLANKNIFNLLQIEKYQVISKNKNPYYTLKNFFHKKISTNPYLNTFILGDKSYLSKEVVSAYQEIGISHLFAISGMHISILSSLLLKLLNRKKVKERNYLIVSLFLLLYLLVIDISPSAIRGVLFFILFSLNKVFYFYVSPLKIYLLTLIIVLLLNPFYVFDIGFLYSFSISFSLIFLSDELKSNNYFISLFKVSLVSFLVSIPISLYNFYQLNLLSIIYNLFYVPFISLLLFPLLLLNFLFPFLQGISDFFIDILEKSAIYLSKISFSKLVFFKANIYLYVFYFLIIVLFLLEYKKLHKKRFLYILLVILMLHFSYVDRSTFIKMLDIGQGDSLLIASKGKAILVDTGGIQNKDPFLISSTTLPVLKSLGFKRLEKLIITHGDFDHIGEAKYLLDNFMVKEVLINNNSINYYERELLSYNAKKAKQGLVFSCGDITLVQLNKNLNDENDSSSVYLGLYKNKSFLLMGDASAETENYLLKNYNLQDVTILKVGHHGSKTSSTPKFIEKINPQISLISAGIDNKFNHPHKEVLTRLQKTSQVYITKDLGTITIDLDSLKINTYCVSS